MFEPDKQIQQSSTLQAFLEQYRLQNYEELVAQSVEEPEQFWSRVIDLADIRFSHPYKVLRDITSGPERMRWAVGGELNLIDTCLSAQIEKGLGDKPAIDWTGEDGSYRVWSYNDLAAKSAQVANALAERGIGKGDVVAIFMPMIPEIEAAFLGIAMLGATIVPLFSGFSAPAIIARVEDAGVKAVLTVDAAARHGKPVPMESVLVEALTGIPAVHTVIRLRRFGGKSSNPDRDIDWAETVDRAAQQRVTTPVSADDPLLIAYTSGTTGKPKGVVHTHLGVMGASSSNFILCLDLKKDDRHLWMSDMGWVMGPLTLISVLLAGATLVMAEGAPSTTEDPFRLLRIAADRKVTHMGVAPTLVRQFMTKDATKIAGYDISHLRIVASTGEPWTEDAWNWHVGHICRNHAVPLNIAGGTELFGAILSSTVLHDQRPCGFSGEALGVGAKILSADGSEVAPGEVGELVVTVPPLGLTHTIWGDFDRYIDTYWSTYPGIWHHGDWVHRDTDGAWFILGRSDDTLNIAGKRIGPPEIEAAITAGGKVVDAAAIAAPDDMKGVAVVCICIAAPGVKPDAELIGALKDAVGASVSKPFRPREIHFVDALPKTRSMKTMRRIVRAAYLGEDPGDLSSLQNPAAIPAIAGLQQGIS